MDKPLLKAKDLAWAEKIDSPNILTKTSGEFELFFLNKEGLGRASSKKLEGPYEPFNKNKPLFVWKNFSAAVEASNMVLFVNQGALGKLTVDLLFTAKFDKKVAIGLLASYDGEKFSSYPYNPIFSLRNPSIFMRGQKRSLIVSDEEKGLFIADF